MMDCDGNDSGDDSSTTTLGDEMSVALLPPPVTKVKAQGRGGGGNHVGNETSRTSASCARISGSSDPAAQIAHIGIGTSTSTTVNHTPPPKVNVFGGREEFKSPISPATQTLNELSGMDVAGDDLMYDMSQLSQLSQNAPDEQETSLLPSSQSTSREPLHSGVDKSASQAHNKIMKESKQMEVGKWFSRRKDCKIYYKRKYFYLGMVASVDESVERREKAREKLDQWDAMYGGIDNIDRNWINEQFIKLNIKVLVDGSSTSKQKKGIPPTLKKSPKASSISVSTKADKSRDQRSSHTNPEKNDDNDFTLHLVFLAELGSFGMIAEKGPRNIFVEKLQQDGQAARNGIRINDLIFKAPSKYMDMYSKAGEGMLLDIDHGDLDVSKLQSPTLEDLLGMSKSTLRPVAFLLKRFVSRQEIEEERACTNVQKTGEIKGNDAMRVTTRKDSPTCHDSEKEGREVANGEEKKEEDISRKKETAAAEEKDESTRWVDNKGGSNKVRNEESRKEKTTRTTTAGSMSSSSSQVHEKTITPNRQCPLSRQVECQAMPVCGGSDSVQCKAVERKKVKSAEKSNREGRGDKTATDNQKGAIRNKPSVVPDKSRGLKGSSVNPEKYENHDDDDFTLHLVFLVEPGSFGMMVAKMETNESPIYTYVKKLQQDGQAARNGIHVNDLIFRAPSKCMDEYEEHGCMLLDVDRENLDVSRLQSVRVEDILGMSKSTLRPVAFLLKRFVSRKEMGEGLTCTNVQKKGDIRDTEKGGKGIEVADKEEKIRRKRPKVVEKESNDMSCQVNSKRTTKDDHSQSKEDREKVCDEENVKEKTAEMTTTGSTALSTSQVHEKTITPKHQPQNKGKEKQGMKSPFSRQILRKALLGKGFPQIPCCRKCKNPSLRVPHHYLCPKHVDFGHSGSKEKLIMLFAGAYGGCEGCIAEIQTGKKKNGVAHSEECQKIPLRGGTDHVQCRPVERKKVKSTEKSKEGGRRSTESSKLRKKKATRTQKPKSHSAKNPPLLSSTHENIPTQNEPLKITDDNRKGTSKLTDDDQKEPLTLTDGSQEESLKLTGDNRKGPLKLTDDNSLPKWIPSHNPWGNRGHCEGDFVLFSSSDYRTAFQLYGPKPKRFTFEPFAEDSSYCKTHVTPQEGVRILEVTRDRLALRAWGFDFCHHDFGGACLVTEVEPLSPADAAIDVGCCRGDVSALQVNDMILCINGKKVSGMTVVDFEVELEVSLSQILLVVAKCRTSVDEPASAYERIGLEETLHWTEVGGDACMRMDRNFRLDGSVESDDDEVVDLDVDVCDRLDKANGTNEGGGSGSESSSCSSQVPILDSNYKKKDAILVKEYNDRLSTLSQSINAQYDTCHYASDEHTPTDTVSDADEHLAGIDADTQSPYKRPTDDKQIAANLPNKKRRKKHKTIERTDSGSTEESEWENDENPWLGCVCGATHETPTPVFWIQCDSCDAWYNVAPKCIGFDKSEAKNKTDWECHNCAPPDHNANINNEMTEDSAPNAAIGEVDIDSQTSSCTAGENDLLTPEKKMPTSFHHWTQKYNMSPIRVGTLVYVTPRLERGSNKPGGAAKVTDYQTTEDDILYDVRYVLSGGREKKLESMYVTLYEEAPECRGDITSPGITTRGASLRNFL